MTNRSPILNRSYALAASILLGAICASSARAQFVWASTTSAAWDSGGGSQWTGGPGGGNKFPDASGETATFNDVAAAAITVSGTGPVSPTSITFNNTTATAYTITTSSITNSAISTTSSGTVSMSSVISGTSSVTKGGSGTLTLSGANTYTGGTTLTAGALNVTGSIANTTALTVDGGTATFSASQQVGSLSGLGGVITFTAGAKTLTVAQASNTSYAGAINGTSVALTKSGAGTLTLSGSSGYTGATTISAGTLKVDGSITATSGTTIASGATLAGSGSISSGTTTLNSGGFISPASGSIGNLSLAALTFNGGSTLSLGLGSGSSSDSLTIAGAFTKGSVGAYTIDFGNTGSANTTYTLATFNSTTFSASDFTALNSNFTGTFAINSGQLEFTTSAIPEPSTYAAILGVGALGLVVYRRRKARSTEAAAVAV